MLRHHFTQNEMTTRKPVRDLNGKGWQVLHNLPHSWVDCASLDAMLIAEAESLCKEVFAGRVGEDVAIRLNGMAAAVVRNMGEGVFVRFIRQAAKRARGVSA